jgi:uncharacterized protein YkwD
LTFAGGECANGGTAKSFSNKFGLLQDSSLLISEKISSGCEYTVVLNLGKANADRAALEKVYLTNNFLGRRTTLSKEKTKDSKIPLNIVLYFTAEAQQDLGVSQTGALNPDSTGDNTLVPTPSPSPSPTPSPTPSPSPSPTPGPSPNPSPSPSPGPSDGATCYKGNARVCKIEQLIADKTNAYRRGQGLSNLQFDPKVAFVSRDWSQKQSQRGDISHDGFASARVAVYRSEFGSSVSLRAENVAYSSCSSRQSEEAIASLFATMWWNSSGHRANMLGGHRAIGVGMYINSSGSCYGTQIFK